MKCANTYALNKHLAGVEHSETALEYFMDAIETDMADIKEILDILRKLAKNYNGYDFTDDLEDMISDL